MKSVSGHLNLYFPAKKGFLPRQFPKRARDTMDTGVHDVARDDTQISHFLDLGLSPWAKIYKIWGNTL